MAQENIKVTNNNFCIAPIIGTYASVDTSADNTALRFKNSSGDAAATYAFNPNIPIGSSIYYLDYIGPRELTNVETGMVFITMESNLSSEVYIKKWNLDKESAQLNLDYTITKATSGDEYIKSKSMAAGRYYTSLSSTTVTGTSSIVIDSVDNVVSGTRLYIGPSSNSSYLNAFEEVIATSVSGTTVSIYSPNGVPLFNYYNVGDPVTYLGDFYLFNDVGFANDSTKGSMLVIDNFTGATLGSDYSAIYSNISAANYGIPFYDTVAIVKNSELLYIDIFDFTIQKSCRLNVTKSYSSDVVPIHAVALTIAEVFCLQESKISRQDTGQYTLINWTSYNYHSTGVSRFADSITLSVSPTGILTNQETVIVSAHVRDQYGVAISGKTVHFDKVYGDIGGTWGEVNKEGVTDINGWCYISYTSGWYDPSFIEKAEEDIAVSAWTDGSNVLTGSIYIWAYMTMLLKAKFFLDSIHTTTNKGVKLVTQKVDSKETKNKFTQLAAFTSDFTLKAYSFFEMPGGHDFHEDLPHVFIVRQLQDFEGGLGITQEKLTESTLPFEQIKVLEGSCPVSQTLVSRHLPVGSNEDNVNIAQFKFIIDAIPVPFSEKNNVNTDIWIKLAPYGFDLNKSTLVFKVREVSYAGDLGFINYENTYNLTVTEYDAGGGLIGLEVLYTPDEYFHNNALVYVYLEVYDNGLPPNRIEFDYWFLVIPDYKAPYITNEIPSREARDVYIGTDVSFDILDTEVGVDITSLLVFINNRSKIFTYEELDKGYRVTYTNEAPYMYEQLIEISIKVNDSSGQSNILYDMWRFKCESSLAPIIDSESFYPPVCVKGRSSRGTQEIFVVYDAGGGLDKDSIELIVGGNLRPVSLVPILKRLT